MNSAPTAGDSKIPTGARTPAANGSATMLYPVAHTRFCINFAVTGQHRDLDAKLMQSFNGRTAFGPNDVRQRQRRERGTILKDIDDRLALIARRPPDESCGGGGSEPSSCVIIHSGSP